ncbi:MBL fold metallo-hydrolase [Thermopirellula anaerolimosa]
MGTGTSHGVPLIGCRCPVCTSDDPRNRRTRCSLAVGLPEGTVLIDTPPELRLQLCREGLSDLRAVLYTHAHADHLFGLDDLRIISQRRKTAVPVYCEAYVEARIRKAFDYAFEENAPAGGVPQLEFITIDTAPFELLGTRVIPLRLKHGPWDVLGFRFGDAAYCTDVKEFPEETLKRLRNLDVLILDCLRHEPHPTHLSVEEALAIIRIVRPRRCYLTHLCHRLDHATFSEQLPPGVEPAYDGLRIRTEISPHPSSADEVTLPSVET